MEKQLIFSKKYLYLLFGILVLLGLYLSSLYNYLLFHSLAELFSIVVACGIFMIAWNSRRFLDNNYLLLIGIAYLFVGGFDLVHTLAYTGMNVFQGYETNLPTQLWISARYMESLSLLIAPLFLRRKLKVNLVFLTYTAASTLLLLFIFYWDIFPTCFIEGIGLTPFKKISEYIISLILLASIVVLLRNRRKFDKNVLQWVVWSIIVSIASELAFTFYIHAYGFSNLAGHYLKILSFYFIYKALIQTSLTRPYNLLFRDLKQSEERFRNLFEQSPIGIELYDPDGHLIEANKACLRIFGVSDVAEVKGFKLFEDPNLSKEVKGKLKRGEAVRYEFPFDFEKVKELQLYKTKKSGIHYVDALITPIGFERGIPEGYLVQVQDITERKRAEEAMEKSSNQISAILASISDGFFALDDELVVTYFNQAAERLLGRKSGEVLGRKLSEAFPEAKGSIFEEKYTWAVKEKKPLSFERYFGIEPYENWYDVRVYPHENGISVYFRVTTERKQAEEALRNALKESEHRHAEISALLEGSRAVLEYHEFKDSARSIFDTCKNLIGATAGYIALLSKDGSENEVLFLDSGGFPCTVDPKLPMPIRGLREVAYRTGKTIYHNDFPKSEYMKYMPEGHADLHNVLFAPLVIQGKVIGLLGLANKPVDFAENDARMASALAELAAVALQNSRTLEALEHSEERNRSVVQTANDAIISVDSQGHIIFWNKSAELTFGYSFDEVMGRPLTFIMPERFRESHQEAMSRVVSTGKSSIVGKTVEMAGLRKDGSEFPIELSLAAWKTGDETFFTGIIRDITERKRAEEALRRSRDELEIRVQERTAELLKAYQKLEEQSKLLEAFFSSTVTPLVFLDRNFNFIRVNEAYAKACQRDVSEFPGHNHFEFYPSDAKAIFEQVVETKVPFQAVARPFVFPDRPEWGITYWDWTLTALLGNTGEVEFLVFSLNDVTARKRAELALRESELWMRCMFNSMEETILIVTPDRILKDINPATQKMFGYSKEALLNHSTEVLHLDRDHYLDFGRRISEAFDRGESANFEYRAKRENGDIFPTEHTVSLLKNDMGEVIGIVSVVRDITERKRAEVSLREQAALLDLAYDAIFVLDFEDKIKFWNKGAEEMYGWRKEEAVGANIRTLLQTEFPKPIDEIVIDLIRKGRWEGELVHTKKDGTSIIVSSRWALQRDEKGNPLNILEINNDITKRKQTEEAQARLTSILEATSDFVGIANLNGKVIYLNQAARQMLGIGKEEDISKMNISGTHSEWANAVVQNEGIPSAVREGLWSGETAFLSRNGTEVPVSQVILSHKSLEGKVQFLSTIARDITERKEEERRIQIRNALLEFFAKKTSRKEYLDAVVDLVCEWSGCRCVGIRVLDLRGYIPYESYIGFSQEFWESENFLSTGEDQCACIRVVTGELNPQDAPVVTPGGSFCCGNTIRFVENLSESEKSRYRGVCIQSGFYSVAITPIRYGEKIIGAVHLADEREGVANFKMIEFIESMTPLIGEAINRFNLEEEVRNSESRLRHLSSELLTVQENERNRISREIHDGLGQTLAAIKFGLESKLGQMRKGAAPPGVSIESIISLAQNGIEESRRIQMDLRPSVLDDLGILATIGWFTREYEKVYSHIAIQKQIHIEENDVPDRLKIVLFRVMQEAMNNIAKHSKANLVRLSLRKMEPRIELSIEDNGAGFDLQTIKQGLGLTSMRERTELSGGSFEIESTPGKGTAIRARWPT